MARLAPGGKYLKYLEESEWDYLAKIEYILEQDPEEMDVGQINELCFAVCRMKEGISQRGQDQAGTSIIMINPVTRRLMLCSHV
jgi:hypothetical protein